MSENKKYWETETPEVLETSKNEIRIFHEAGKIQTYAKVPSAPRGLSKGVTIDLSGMEVAELEEFRVAINKAIDGQLEI